MSAVLADARRFADMHALYRMFDDRGRLLYIGITKDPGQRFGEHSAKRWFPLVETIKLEWLPTKAAARIAEKRAIGSERPRYNRQDLRAAAEVRRTVRPVDFGKRGVLVAHAELAAMPRDLLADIDAVIGEERLRLSAIPHLLRQIAPHWESYQGLTGVRLQALLSRRGIRTIKPGNVPRLDPADFRKVYRKADPPS